MAHAVVGFISLVCLISLTFPSSRDSVGFGSTSTAWAKSQSGGSFAHLRSRDALRRRSRD